MTEAGAEKAVLGSFLAIGGTLIYRDIRRSGKATPPFRQLVALVILAAVMTGLAGAVPGIVGPLAILIAISYLIATLGA